MTLIQVFCIAKKLFVRYWKHWCFRNMDIFQSIFIIHWYFWFYVNINVYQISIIPSTRLGYCTLYNTFSTKRFDSLIQGESIVLAFYIYLLSMSILLISNVNFKIDNKDTVVQIATHEVKAICQISSIEETLGK